MDGKHNFSDQAKSISWDENSNEIIVRRECRNKQHTHKRNKGRPSRGVSDNQWCKAKKENVYKIRSVVDYHEFHDEPSQYCVVLMEDGYVPDYAIHIDSLDDIPDWIDEVVEQAKNKIEDIDAKYFTSRLGGSECSLTLATSETEYNVTLKKVDERIVQN